MDDEKFDRLLMDELYGELDPETSAAMKRWAAAHPSAAEKLATLGATRRAAADAFPPLAPPDDLEARILAATRRAHTVLPLRRRAAVAISRAGAWAMRPQTAMAAVFLLMIGSSALLLKGKYVGQREAASATYTVTEQGSPQSAPAAEEAKPLDPVAAELAHGTEAKAAATANAAPEPPPSALEMLADDSPRARGKESRPATQGREPPSMDQAASAPPGESPRDEEGSGYGWAAPPAPKAAARKPMAAAPPPPPPSRRDVDMPSSNAGLVAGAPKGGAATGSSESDGVAGIGALAPAAGPAPTRPAANAAAGGGGAKDKSDSKKAEGDGFVRAMASYRARNFAEATSTWDALANGGDLTSELWAGRSVRDGRGCAAALPRFEALASRAFATVAGQEATLEAGRCHKALGDVTTARARFSALLTVPQLMATAQRELDALAPRADANRTAPAKAQKQKPAAESR